MLNGLDLFSGIGGISLAFKDWIRPAAYCEIDPYCQGVLLSRMADEFLYDAPIWDDITTFSGVSFRGNIDIIYGGFPCQDISIAGLGKGLAGERSSLFYEIIRLCREIEPRFIFLENVPAITSRGGVEVVREITSMGYDCRWCIISASSIGALHRRERWFLLAHIKNDSNTHSISSQQTDKISKSNEDQRQSWGGSSRQHWPFESREHWQKTVSKMGKCTDGISNHVDRLKSLGNAVVPQQAKEAFKILIGNT